MLQQYLKQSLRAHVSLRDLKTRKGSPDSSTRAFLMTGLSLPLRLSMVIMLTSGVPPACHCWLGRVRPDIVAISPVCLAPSSAPAA